MTLSKFNIVLCELHNPILHGKTTESDPTIDGQYLVTDKLEPNDFFDKIYLQNYIKFITLNYTFFQRFYSDFSHSIIRNYHKIISQKQFIKPEIAESIYLSGGECVAILKTFWIKIIQRKWKKIFQQRQNILFKRRQANEIRHHQLTGQWKTKMPSIIGLLSS
jgi:hypothetical protein